MFSSFYPHYHQALKLWFTNDNIVYSWNVNNLRGHNITTFIIKWNTNEIFMVRLAIVVLKTLHAFITSFEYLILVWRIVNESYLLAEASCLPRLRNRRGRLPGCWWDARAAQVVCLHRSTLWPAINDLKRFPVTYERYNKHEARFQFEDVNTVIQFTGQVVRRKCVTTTSYNNNISWYYSRTRPARFLWQTNSPTLIEVTSHL